MAPNHLKANGNGSLNAELPGKYYPTFSTLGSASGSGKLGYYHNSKYDNKSFAFDSKIRSFLIFLAVVLIIYKTVAISMPYTSSESLYDVSAYVQDRFNESYEWLSNSNILKPFGQILCGLGFTLFSCLFVYFDSSVPGVYPPSPFSPRSKMIYRNQKASSIHLGYLTAVLSGVIVTVLLMSNF